MLLPASGGGCERQHLWSCYQQSSDLSLCVSLSVPSCLSRASVIMARPAPKWPHLTLIIYANIFNISNVVLVLGLVVVHTLLPGRRQANAPHPSPQKTVYFVVGWLGFFWSVFKLQKREVLEMLSMLTGQFRRMETKQQLCLLNRVYFPSSLVVPCGEKKISHSLYQI